MIQILSELHRHLTFVPSLLDGYGKKDTSIISCIMWRAQHPQRCIRWLFYYRANNDKYHLNSRATIKQKQILGLGLKHMHKLWVTQAVVTTHTHTHTHTHKSWVKATVGGPTGTVWMSPTRLMEALPHTHTHTLQQNTRQITSKATTGGLQPLLHYLETRRWSIIKLLHRFPSQSCNSSR